MRVPPEAGRFHARSTPQPRPESGAWQSSPIAVFDGDRQVGEYLRNHPGNGETTFEPFGLKGAWYALYARDYTATRVTALPECRDLGGEEGRDVASGGLIDADE